ncbi:MAG: stage III sporulation protein AB [Clostridia bacterium]|nr:stage III sporulation protein AB [Clostridia bacterium]
MVKAILCATIVFSMGYVSFAIGRMYRRKVRFYEELLAFIAALKIDINYKQSLIADFAGSFACSSELTEILELFASNKAEPCGAAIVLKIFGDEENAEIEEFFSYLGKSDAVAQTSHLDFYAIRFEERLCTAKQKLQSEGRLYAKLGIMLALFICLIII